MTATARTLRIGTRGSALALVQARWVAARLAASGVGTEIVVIRTEGDDRPVDTAWGEGAFVGRIVGALMNGSVDIAVHSAKDIPTDEAPELEIAAYPVREDPRDAIVCRVRGTTLATLPSGARVGTDSPRRVAFLRALRPDLRLHPLHGNVDSRLAKLDRGESDALVLAVAGLVRLGRADRIDEILDAVRVPPAPGQGSLAVQVRAGDVDAVTAVRRLDDPATRAAVETERAMLRATGGGCRSPIGALGTVTGDGQLEVVAAAERTWVAADDAPLADSVARVARLRAVSPVNDRAELAGRLARRVLAVRDRPRVLTLRPAARAAPLLAALAGAGFDAVNVPAIEIVPAPPAPIEAAIQTAQPGQRIIVTSANGALAVLRALDRLGIGAGRFAWACTGEATRTVLIDAGADDAFIPATADGESLGAEVPIAPGQPVLLVRGELADPSLAATLRARGASVAEVVAYRTIEGPIESRALLAAALDDGPVDVVVVTSGSAARGLIALAADPTAERHLRATPAVAIGRPSAAATRSAGFETVLASSSPAPHALASFITEALGVRLRTPPDPVPVGDAR